MIKKERTVHNIMQQQHDLNNVRGAILKEAYDLSNYKGKFL